MRLEQNRKNDPMISIVMAVYNGASFINASVAAALAQDYSSFEVIVIDDGSIDETEMICRAIHDQRLRYVQRERRGSPTALNEGISLARGEYIAVNDSDDLSFPERLRYVVNFLKAHNDVAVVATAYEKTSTFYQTIPKGTFPPTKMEIPLPEWISPSRLYRSNPFVHSTLIFPKAIWKLAGGYDEDLGMCIDYDFTLRAAQFGKVAWLPERTVLWYTNPTSFYKKKSTKEYLNTLSFIKGRARRQLKMPAWVRLYDLMMIYRRFVNFPVRASEVKQKINKVENNR